MACFSPLTGYYSKEIGSSGKRGITFQRSASFSGRPIRIPCGQCVGCRLEKSRQWAMRLMHEKRVTKDCCFVTLTYNDKFLPPYGTLVKRDLQLFMKRLRKEKGNGIRFYACGEYGDLNRRPHYHVLLFNCDFEDKKVTGANRRGDKYYSSLDLSAIWSVNGESMGLTHIGDVTWDSCAYVARYVLKKITGPLAADHYDVVDSDGVIFRRIPEFTVMSRRPGIGMEWFKRYGAETYQHDSVIVNRKPVRPPRFYDTKFGEIDPDRLAVLKSIRRHKAALNRRENIDPSRRRVKEIFTEKVMKHKRREV